MKIKELITVKTCIVVFCMALMFTAGYFIGSGMVIDDITISPGIDPSLQYGDEQTAGLININTASAEELDKLPEVGPKLAERIIQYRTENGKFERIEDIGNVEGIGDGVFAKIRHLITVG